ncbi:energy-coupling factor transporter transmembrane component T family protein [Mycoplasma mycoides]|uniref:energy-coupling factor transporter transmembrane component T family protein n=1 Tax=Mycoplasma mycoides TaxID=2102 RepID=UPI00273412B4|nr:energy-coupling factor transporter transmembrane component T [Mycoplasma mycoides]MDP4040295.1 energy-coupling factor transporter transmembrane component T [Mycoplasma mycoides]MDP4041161.1 energy-coupling factor transporter transmembrane component T [Mycoplasma mycoides]MDP4042164.1 energy-coupling factor transporter transmembrane component T [Mycoplasma mycoides]MDP4043566.1 energy-coupling factor transporter transmembrane component T [Mycoplasma mycoides]MDP4044434.1 energy-coupling fact
MRISFGRYIPKNSLIHKMDPRLKLFMIMVLIVSVFFPIGLTGYLIISGIIIGLFALSQLSFKMLVRLLVPVTFIFTIIVLMNFFFIHPSSNAVSQISSWVENNPNKIFWTKSNGTIVGQLDVDAVSQITNSLGKEIKNLQPIGYFFNWKVFWFSEKALYSALVMGMRIYLMITLTCILTGSTPSLQLTLAIEDLLSPLRLIKAPVYILSMIISIALRMIPTLIDEAGRIMKAQASRGIDIKNGKFKDKVKSLTSLIIPLLVSSFQKAEDLAYAMDARGYDPNATRTRFVQFKFRIVDAIIFVLGISFAIFMMVYGSNPHGIFTNWHISHIDSLVAY